MDGEELQVQHGHWLDEKLRPLGGGLSEYCFANLYLYRHVHDYRLIRGQRHFVSGRTYDGRRHLLPLFDPASAAPRELAVALNGYDFFYPLSGAAVESLDPQVFAAEFVEDDSDYVYDADKLRSYRGVKLRKKRNLMSQFLRAGSAETYPLTPARRPDAREVLVQWQAEVGRPREETDYAPCDEALEQLDPLGLTGFMTYMGGEPAGFVLGGESRPGEFIVHFAKGKREFTGVFPYLFHDLAKRQGNRFLRYNFEQDLGRPNFRLTKRSYDPAEMRHKYRVRCRYPTAP